MTDNELLQAISDIVDQKVSGIVDQKVSEIKLHLENVTDKNIQLLAENHIELTNKLNQAIPVANKNAAYEVKVDYLVKEIDKLKKVVSEHSEKLQKIS
jgi:hypothetical protein